MKTMKRWASFGGAVGHGAPRRAAVRWVYGIGCAGPPSLNPSVEAGAPVVFEALATTVEVESRPDRQALFPRYARYHALLSHLPRRVRRRLQRQWRRSLAAIALLLALGQAPALAATLTVAGGTPPAANADGACSLIEAIENANADAQTHADCPSGSGPDTIVLPASSTQTLTQFHNGEDFERNGLPVIGSAITIEGNGSTIMGVGFSGPNSFRIFAVDNTGNLTLKNTTVSGGFAFSSGGGLLNRGNLTLMNSTVSGNGAAFGGGGVSNGGTLTLMNSTVSGNRADEGGGVSNRGTLTLSNSTLSGNFVGFGSGGGLLNFVFATAILTDSTVSGNTARAAGTRGGGGGVFNNAGTVTLINSTVSGNVAGDPADSSIPNALTPRGGGVLNHGTLTLRNSTVSGNFGQFGGGVYNLGTLTLKQALVSGNTDVTSAAAEVGNALPNAYNAGNIIANDFNLFGHVGLTDAQAFSGFTPGPTDLTATSDGDVSTALAAILDTTLANNGGPTETHALVAGSPAIDAVAIGCPPPATDQRGVGRPQPRGGDCDIGAFEGVAGSPRPITCNGRPATIVGNKKANTILGTPGNDVIHGRGGNDVIRGFGGNDVICGGAGNDQLFGDQGTDQLFGQGGNDVLKGGTDNDRLFGQGGNDTLDGQEGNDDGCNGGRGNDTAVSCEQLLGVP